MKKFFMKVISVILFILLLAGCGSSAGGGSGGGANVEGGVEELLQRIYDGLGADIQLPFLMNIPLSEDMGVDVDGIRISYYLGTTGIPFSEGVASEAAIGGAYSVCLLRMNAGADIEKAKKDIADNVDSAKWICYIADKVIVDNRGDLVILIMTNDETSPGVADAIHESFLKL